MESITIKSEIKNMKHTSLPKSGKMTPKIREEILFYRSQIFPPLKPMQIYTTLVKKYAENETIIPTHNQISDLISYEEIKKRKETNAELLRLIETYSQNLVNFEDFGSQFYIIMRTNLQTHQKFLNVVKDNAHYFLVESCLLWPIE